MVDAPDGLVGDEAPRGDCLLVPQYGYASGYGLVLSKRRRLLPENISDVSVIIAVNDVMEVFLIA